MVIVFFTVLIIYCHVYDVCQTSVIIYMIYILLREIVGKYMYIYCHDKYVLIHLWHVL